MNPGAPGSLSGGLYVAPSIIANTQTVTVTATSNADRTKSASAAVTLQPSAAPPPPPPPPSAAIRIRAGDGGAYTDSQGRLWSADSGYSGSGGVFNTASAISNTSDQPLYQSERWTYPGALQYDFQVPNGAYTVNLKFAENYATGPGQRVFDVVINGQMCAAGYDIFARAGGAGMAVDQQCTGSSNGVISIQFLPVAGAPKINSIEIL